MAENRSAPPNPVTPDAIHQLATGFMAAKHLFVANEVGLFEKLALGPANLDRLAELTGIAQPRVRILADALVALGMIERQDDRYQNGPAAAAFLSGQGPGDLCPYLRFFNQISYPQWANLEETIRTGHVQENTGRSPEQQRIVSQGVEANQAPQANALPTAYDFAGHQRMLDLGGGTGSWLAALLRHCDHLTGTVFDLPDVAGIARERLAGELRTQRAQVMYGDFWHDPIPDGYDAVLLANVVHLYSAARNRELLHRIRASAPDDGRLLVADWWKDSTHTQPHIAAIMAGQFCLSTGEGAVYSEDEIQDWLRETGWSPVVRTPLAGPVSLIVPEATAPR